MQTRYLYSLKFLLAMRDLFLVNAAFSIGLIFTNHFYTSLSYQSYYPYQIAANLIWYFCAHWCGVYNSDGSQPHQQHIRRSTWRCVALHFVFVMFYITFSRDVELSRFFILTFYGIILSSFLTIRYASGPLESMVARRFKIHKTVAVLGRNVTGSRLAHYFATHSEHYKFEGFLEEHPFKLVEKDGNYLVSASGQMQKAVESGVNEVYVSLAPERISQAHTLMEEAERLCVRVKFVLDLEEKLAVPFEINYLGNFPVINLRREPLQDMNNRFKKRVQDILFSSCVLIFVMSWLYPLLAIIIKLQSRGPVMFRQLRTGRDNKPFYCYKFRSMRVNADSDTKQAEKNDNRITPIGHILRKYSIDEIPQFFNVLKGNMSVVGPRPHMLKHTEEYRSVIDRFMVRHYLKPGITGWAQVNGLRGETRDPGLMEKRVQKDIWYGENWSTLLDVKIIAKTVVNVFKGEENAR